MPFERLLTVTAGPAQTRLTTRAAIQAAFGAFADGAAMDTLIDRATAEFMSRLGYPSANGGAHAFARSTYEEKIETSQAVESINLSRRFLTQKPAVTINGEVIDPADIEAAFGAGVLRRLSGGRRVDFPGGAVIVATYPAGFLLPGEEGRTLPHDVEAAVIDLIGLRRLSIAGAGPCAAPISSMNLPGAGAINFNVETPALVDALPGAVHDAIEAYRFRLAGWS